MENRLAGQHSADRRRRRMSTDLHDEELFQEFFPEAALPMRTVPQPLLRQDSDATLLRRVISPSLWKHGLLLTFGAILVGVVLWWEHRESRAVGDLRHQQLAAGLAGLLLMVSGQLALVTGWLRTDSEIDFQGRYRWWTWLSLGFFAAAVTVATHSQSEISNLVAALLEPVMGSIRSARQAIVLVPGITYGIIVLGRILPDMSRSRLSQSLLVVAVLTMTVRWLQSGHASVLTVRPDALLLAAAYVAFASMLLHCRFVAYVCHDPPVRNTSTSQAPTVLPVVTAKTELDVSIETRMPLEADATASAKTNTAANDDVQKAIEPPPTKRKAQKRSKQPSRKAA
ncbi:MAG: hypothetical protein R3C59_19755 [Planctomycetaceae bacterium]